MLVDNFWIIFIIFIIYFTIGNLVYYYCKEEMFKDEYEAPEDRAIITGFWFVALYVYLSVRNLHRD